MATCDMGKKRMVFFLCCLAIAFGLGCRFMLRERNRRMHYRPLGNIKLMPHAVGRYLIEFPEDSLLKGWYQRFQGTGNLSLIRNVSQEEFESEVKRRADHFQAIKHDRGGTRLEKVVELRIPQGKAVLYWDDDVSPKTGYLECDGFYLKEDVMFKFPIMAASDPTEQAIDLSFLEKRMEAIRFRRPDEIPTEPGTCFDGAILLDRPGLDYFDHVSVGVVWPDRPDVRFSFTVFGNGPRPDPPFLTRVKHAGATPLFGVLRSGPRDVDGNAGEEHLERVTEENGTISHLFHWEAQGLPCRFDRPQLILVMTTGNGQDGPVYASLSDKDALNLWDAVLTSLRWRPTVPATQPKP